jgi:hypothetical protein
MYLVPLLQTKLCLKELDEHYKFFFYYSKFLLSLQDIVVCEICGSGSIPHLIAKCALCNAHEHRYSFISLNDNLA